MLPLFSEKSFSEVMKERLSAMKSEIEKLKCSDVMHLKPDSLIERAEHYACKYAPVDLPVVRSGELEKSISDAGKPQWKIPFSGGKVYFSYTPSKCETGQSVDRIEEGLLVISIDAEDDGTAKAGAEQKASEMLASIENAIVCMQRDADTNFSRERFASLAQATLETKRASCAKLIAAGYSVR